MLPPGAYNDICEGIDLPRYKAKEKRAQELKAAQDLLEKPLETFGDTEAERLAAKYQQEAAESRTTNKKE